MQTSISTHSSCQEDTANSTVLGTWTGLVPAPVLCDARGPVHRSGPPWFEVDLIPGQTDISP